MSDEAVDFIHGFCKWYNVSKGFGFLQYPGSGMDVFCHANQLRKSGINKALVEGQKVKFQLEQGPKGQFATNISLVEGE